MAKDKKKNKGNKAKGAGSSSRLKEIAGNPMVADLVAAALVSTAAALKDSGKAKALASQAGDELEKLATKSARKGDALWQLALDVGRKALDSIVGDSAAPKKAAKPVKKLAARNPVAKKAATKKPAAKKPAAKRAAKPAARKRSAKPASKAS